MELWAENYKYLGTLEHWKVDKIFDTGPNAPVTHSAEEARRLVLAGAGAEASRPRANRAARAPRAQVEMLPEYALAIARSGDPIVAPD